MKINFNYFTALSLFLIVNYSAYSQWDLTGNAIGTGQYLGTNNNFPLDFRTNGSQQMRLTQTGFLGLGTNAPSSFFHLNTTATGELFRTVGTAGNLNVRT